MFNIDTILLIAIILWTLPWKGIALWKAARIGHMRWFTVILIVNTLAILDIYYIYKIATKYKVETNDTTI